MIELDYDKNSELKFTLDISGQPGPVDEIRFVMNKDNKKVCYEGKLDGKIVTVQLDRLNEIFAPGEHDYSLEIIIGNQYFKPIQDRILLKENIKITSTVVESKTTDVPDSIQVTKVETKSDVVVAPKKSIVRTALTAVEKPVVEEKPAPKVKTPTKVGQFLNI